MTCSAHNLPKSHNNPFLEWGTEAQRSETMLGGVKIVATGRPGAPTSCLIPVPGSACMESAQAYVGNFMLPREQKALTFLPCAGTCQLLIVFGSLCSRWALPVCQVLCVGSLGCPAHDEYVF